MAGEALPDEALVDVTCGNPQVTAHEREPKCPQKALDEKLHRIISQRKSKMAQNERNGFGSKLKIDNMKNNGEHVTKAEVEILSFSEVY